MTEQQRNDDTGTVKEPYDRIFTLYTGIFKCTGLVRDPEHKDEWFDPIYDSHLSMRKGMTRPVRPSTGRHISRDHLESILFRLYSRCEEDGKTWKYLDTDN